MWSATGFDDPWIWAILSDQPAYQTHRSIAASTSSPARAIDPLVAANLVDELRSPSLEQLRHPVQDLTAVVRRGGRPAGERLARGDDCVARVLRDASAALATNVPRLSFTAYDRPDSLRGNAPPTYSLYVLRTASRSATGSAYDLSEVPD